MKRTRNSFYFAAGYLYFGGAGFLLLPSAMQGLLFGEGIYSSVSLRLLGGLMLSLAMLLTGVIERETEVIYRQVILAAIPALLALGYIYWDSLDRMWLHALVIAAGGWLASLLCYLLDRRATRGGVPLK